MAATGTIAPFPKHHFLDSNGDPLAAALLFTYEAGSTTKLATYTDVNLSVANANPIVLDSAGRATIFLSAASYKFVLAPSTDTDPPTSPIWTVDNVSATPGFNVNLDVTGTAGEALSANNAVYLSDGSGGLTAGRWYKADADNTYSSTTAGSVGFATSAITSGSSGGIRLGGRVTGLSGLTISNVYYLSSTAGAITNSAPTNARAVGVADSATTLILAPVVAAGMTVGPLPAISGSSLTGVDKYLDSEIATVGNVDAGEDVLSTYSLDAAKLATDGETIKGIFWGKTANNANAKTLKIHIDDTAVDTTILSVSLTVSEAGRWVAGFVAIRTGAATCRAVAQASVSPSGTQASFAGGDVTSSFTCTWANAVEVRVTGEATTTNDITLEGGQIVLVSV